MSFGKFSAEHLDWSNSMSLTIVPPYRRPLIAVPPYPYYISTQYMQPSAYNTAQKIMDIADQMTSNVNGDLLTMDHGANGYGYVFSPVSNGTIQFTDTSNNTIGGWDGATWPDGDIGETFGPKTISLDFGAGADPWYVYRTDFTGIGLKTWKLVYSRDQ